MYEIMTIILVLAGAFAVVGGIAYFLQRNVREHGNLFTHPATPGMRIFAFILGLIFAGAFFMEILSSGRFHVVLPFLSFFTIAYSFGFNSLLETLQKKEK
jgi:hypothetical protein